MPLIFLGRHSFCIRATWIPAFAGMTAKQETGFDLDVAQQCTMASMKKLLGYPRIKSGLTQPTTGACEWLIT
jgi:hypothetical protein